MNQIVKRKACASFVALALLMSAFVSGSNAQNKRRASATTPAAANVPAPLAALPQSDVVMLIDVKRILNEALPRVFADNPQKLADINAQIDRTKTKYGIDLRSFERLAVGVRFTNPTPAVTKTTTVVIASGSFNAGAMVAAARIAAKGPVREEKVGAKTISIFKVNDQISIPGLTNIKVTDLAAVALDANTLAIGDPAGVRATLDAARTRGRNNAELIALATRNPNALISMGANVPASAAQSLQMDNEQIGKAVATIRQAYGSIGMNDNGYDMSLSARTTKQEDAQTLTDTLNALKSLGGILASQLSADKRQLAQNALDNLKITQEGNEAQIRLDIAQADITTLMHVFDKRNAQR